MMNLKLEVKNMLQNFNINQAEGISPIQNWLGRQGLQLLETQTEREACNDEGDLFKILNNKIKPQYNETIISLQIHNLVNQ